MKTKLQSFAVFCNQMCGQTVKAKNFKDLLENRMTKRLLKFWSGVKFKDEENNTISITREFLDEQGMTFEEIVADWKEHATPEQLEETIHTIN